MATAVKKESYGLRAVKVAVLVVFLFDILFFLYFLVSFSLKPLEEIRVAQTFYPVSPTLANFKTIFNPRAEVSAGVRWLNSLINSVIVSLGNVGLCLAVGIPAAYVFSREKFMADKHIFFWLLINRMAPPSVFAIPYYAFYHSIELYDKVAGPIIAHSLGNIPLAVWILSGFMKDISRDIDEAAFIDGMGIGSFFRRILLPTLMPGITVTAFFIWLFSWSELLLTSAITARSAVTLTVNLLISAGSMGYGIDWGAICAAGTFSIIPGLIFIVLAGRYLVKGFTLGRI